MSIGRGEVKRRPTFIIRGEKVFNREQFSRNFLNASLSSGSVERRIASFCSPENRLFIQSSEAGAARPKLRRLGGNSYLLLAFWTC